MFFSSIGVIYMFSMLILKTPKSQDKLHRYNNLVIDQSILMLSAYTAWRKWCGLRVPRSFDDMMDVSEVIVQKFKKLYRLVTNFTSWIATSDFISVNYNWKFLIAHVLDMLQ